ncbi:alpha/beta hydrolase family esterase [Actinomadura sp. 9N407]|uniref:alpha/beta hydrolase family esterase n=1 Tax=Actinomadura sp. 9N407 TaxID=3375154 RepID=UPI003798F296
MTSRPIDSFRDRFRARRLYAGIAMAAVALVVPVPSSPSAAADTRADAVRPDRITITAAGTPAYRLEGDLTSGGIAVTDTVGDYKTDKVQGQGAMPGSRGGSAQVTFKLARSIIGVAGTFSVRDESAGVEISAKVFGNVQAPSDGTVTWQGNGIVRRDGRSVAQAVGFTVQDRRPDPGDHAIHLTHAGQKRVAILRLPDDYDGSPRPALFHFPGLIETPWMAEFFGRMADHAQSHGFIMITPEHHGIGWQGVGGGPAEPDVDDPGFVAALQDVLVERFNADPRRLYASGMSNGGFFTSKMACENTRFAAFAPVAGQLGDQAACRPGRRVPIVMLHGDADPLVPYSTATAAAPFWARNNGCAATTTDVDLPDIDPKDGTTVTRHTYGGCPADAPVILYRIKGGGHNWPGGIPFLGPVLGGTTRDIDANAVIWDFVSRFRL